MDRIKTQGAAGGGDRMTKKAKPLAGTGQAQQQRVSNKASNLYPQNTHSSNAGQGKQSFNNPVWSQGPLTTLSTREEMRYCYHDRFYQQNPIHGMHCDPVKNAADKCICNRWSMLVRFEDGTLAVVGNRRALRLRHKCKIHTDGSADSRLESRGGSK